jgi:hypothetical protein
MTPDLSLVTSIATPLNLPADLLMKQIQVESSWDEWALRFEPVFFLRYVKGRPEAKAGHFGPLAACSYGLLQVMLEVAYEIGFTGRPEDLFDPQIGLLWGCKKLRAIWDRHPAMPYEQVLAIYNGGVLGNLAPPYRNQSYIDRIMKA